MSIIIIKTVKEMHALSDSLRMQGKTIGFVPTMGFLHEGHAALIQKAASENDIVIVSVFVNPLQFSATEDYGIYPKNFEGDCAIIEQSHGNILFYQQKTRCILPTLVLQFLSEISPIPLKVFLGLDILRVWQQLLLSYYCQQNHIMHILDKKIISKHW